MISFILALKLTSEPTFKISYKNGVYVFGICRKDSDNAEQFDLKSFAQAMLSEIPGLRFE